MSDDTPDLELVSRRIRGLLAKTIEAGATEAEVLLASAKARELMDRYRLSLTDVQVQAEPIDYATFDRPTKSKLVAVDYCVSGISRYCGVKMWFMTEGKVRRIRLLGLRGDVEMAHYLYDMIAAVIEVEGKSFKKREHDTRVAALMDDDNASFRHSYREVGQSFQVGMANRINERLKQMAADLEPVAKTASGTALVVVKGALVDEAFAQLGIRLSPTISRMQARSYAAYEQGQAAGSKVNLLRPVGYGNTGRIQ